MNDNVGRGDRANNGLILQTKKPEIDENESGLLQATLLFNLLNSKYPALKPARGTPLSDLPAGDDLTATALADLSYLGVRTSKFVRDGLGKGIGQLEVLAQGAVLTNPPADVVNGPVGDQMTEPDRSTGSTLKTLNIPISPHDLDPGVSDTTNIGSLQFDYHSIDLTFEYVANLRSDFPRFLKSDYPFDHTTRLVTIDGPQTMALLIDRVRAKITTQAFLNDIGMSGTWVYAGQEYDVPESIWAPLVVAIGAGARFEQPRAGLYYRVTETVSIELARAPDGTLDP